LILQGQKIIRPEFSNRGYAGNRKSQNEGKSPSGRAKERTYTVVIAVVIFGGDQRKQTVE
jgi:hypothetical protein